MPQEIRDEVSRLALVGTKPRSILASVQTNACRRDIYNMKSRALRDLLQGDSVAEALLKQLSESGSYFWNYLVDEGGRISHLFLAHRVWIQVFKENNDILILDCTYKTNKYKLPLLNFVAVTRMNTTFQLAICFLESEKEVDYIWAITQLKRLLDENDISTPPIIFIDQEIALVNAIESVLYNALTSIIICLWHVYKNVGAYAKKYGEGIADIELFKTDN